MCLMTLNVKDIIISGECVSLWNVFNDFKR